MLQQLLNFSYIHLIALILALLPALGWIYIFNKKHPERKKIIAITFFVGILSTFIILAYQYFWDNTFNFVFLNIEPVNFKQSIVTYFDFESHFHLKRAAEQGIFSAILATFFIFVGVGAMEEYMKHWVVKIFDRPFFQSIDDVIELSIIAALGFAFFENIIYFISKWEFLNSIQFGVFVFFRITIVTMVHVLCSGVFGYFYGLAYFAHPILIDEEKQKKKFFFTEWIHKILHLKKETVFRDEKIMEGLILAIVLHAIYDFILEINWTVGDIISIFGIESNIHIGVYIFMMPLYLIGGYFYLSYLLEKKEDHKIYGKLYLREEFSGSLKAKTEYTKEELEKLQKEKKNLGNKISVFNRFIKDEEKQITEEQDKIKNLMSEKEKLKEEIAEEKDLETKISDMRNKEQKMEEKLTEEEKEKESLEEKIKKESQEEKELEEKKSRLEEEITKLEKKKKEKDSS